MVVPNIYRGTYLTFLELIKGSSFERKPHKMGRQWSIILFPFNLMAAICSSLPLAETSFITTKSFSKSLQDPGGEYAICCSMGS